MAPLIANACGTPWAQCLHSHGVRPPSAWGAAELQGVMRAGPAEIQFVLGKETSDSMCEPFLAPLFSLFFLMLLELIALWLPTREHPEQTAACGKLAWEKPERSRLIRLGFGQRVLGDPFKCVDERTQH